LTSVFYASVVQPGTSINKPTVQDAIFYRRRQAAPHTFLFFFYPLSLYFN